MPRPSHATTTERSSLSAASTSAARDRRGAGAQGQARRAQVLGLHREQPPDDARDAGRARAVQRLRRRAGATHGAAAVTRGARLAHERQQLRGTHLRRDTHARQGVRVPGARGLAGWVVVAPM